MIGFYTPLFILQAFCAYHAYQNNAEQRWYWLIICFPGLGCAIYLYHNFYNRNNIQTLTENVKGVVNSNYKIEQLEKAVRFSDSISNKANLADAYVSYQRYADAIVQYKECLTGYMADDAILRMKLLSALYLNQNYELAIECGQKLESEKQFKNADQRIAYAWALQRVGKTEQAHEVFKDMNRSFTNYNHRVAFCQFLIETNKLTALQNCLNELIVELEHMKGPERKLYRNTIPEIKDLYKRYGQPN